MLGQGRFEILISGESKGGKGEDGGQFRVELLAVDGRTTGDEGRMFGCMLAKSCSFDLVLCRSAGCSGVGGARDGL